MICYTCSPDMLGVHEPGNMMGGSSAAVLGFSYNTGAAAAAWMVLKHLTLAHAGALVLEITPTPNLPRPNSIRIKH